ncbi:hypothetical protein B4122_2681 [Bacillus subtilis]|uniref:Uncharacterized protein n=1 Tax=Bacillus subtilis TaxID=1423 RepID=A0AAP1E9A3_BACIU|nr:hypothetical protein B4122_2681 [Bacillus subtilis]
MLTYLRRGRFINGAETNDRKKKSKTYAMNSWHISMSK